MLVLWTIGLLAILAISFVHDTSSQAKIARNRYDVARARALADTGVSLAILGVLGRSPDAAWRFDGSSRELTYDAGQVVVRLHDEAGKIDLNYATDEVLANLLRILGFEEEEAAGLADAVRNWKRRRLSYWSQLSGSRDAVPPIQQTRPFLAVEELREVPGVTLEIYDRVSPFLTVLSLTDQINPLSASREVLLSLPGADAREIDAYVSARREFGPDPKLLPALASLEGHLSSHTPTYVSITSEGRLPTGVRYIREATVSFAAAAGQGFRFISWQQGR